MGKNRALVIGINEYEDPSFVNLKYAEIDAKTIYNILINQDIGEFKEEDVILLDERPTSSKVQDSIGKILDEAGRDDLVFIYFAGHGKLDRLGKLCLALRDTYTEIVKECVLK